MSNSMSPHLLKKMSEILSKLNRQIHNIDNGGCGVFAVALAKILRQHGYDARIVGLSKLGSFWYYDEDDSIIPHNVSLINAYNEGRYVDVTKSHYIVKVGNVYIDNINIEKTNKMRLSLYNSGAGYAFHFKILKGYVPIKYLSYLNSLQNAWNSRYDRRNNTKIEMFLRTHLSPILKAEYAKDYQTSY